ncbi:penicillin-binding transpeptidase domain-containing protein [Rhodothermus marinus]|uniref:penicillin-binding transpeptidase domain-containing protein n=1 Tax=Rhodothermus marinus TaxID=29549 RepID=UPI000A5BE3DB|nr:penicillin-binding transpeptidase domain-containing protein [Rhodothermus marinus]
MDSLKAVKTRLEAGFVAIDPRNGYVRAWVGGRDLTRDWYDHVAIARRQPGSTFKPFLYTAAIDNGWSPYDVLPDSSVTYVDAAGNVWRPRNAEGESTGQLLTLRERWPARSTRFRPGWCCRWARATWPSTPAVWASKVRWKKCPRWRWAPAT